MVYATLSSARVCDSACIRKKKNAALFSPDPTSILGYQLAQVSVNATQRMDDECGTECGYRC